MILQRRFLIIFTLAVLASLAGQARAERLYERTAQGNNCGISVYLDWGCPLGWRANSPAQFPKGSGNLFTNDIWTVGTACTRDFDGDGAPEDTFVLGSGVRDMMASLCSIWAEDLLAELAAGPIDLESATGNRAGTDIDQVWSSLDADNLETWPLEMREGYSPTGAPVIKGAETLVFHTGEVFNSWYGPTAGAYFGWSMYFLDFGYNNNMVHGHVLLHQVTHYMKWNGAYGTGSGSKADPWPDGWKWYGFSLINNQRAMQMGGIDCKWAFHPERELVVHYGGEPTIGSFTPPEPPQVVWKMTRKPRFEDQEMALTNMNVADNWWTGSFGFAGSGNLYAMGLSNGQGYAAAVGKFDPFPGSINPFTGREMNGWPGMLEPEDERFDQWLWAKQSWDTYTCYGELKDMMPRDTTSFDFVIMFVPAEGRTIVPPETDITNMDDQGMQDAFSLVEDYDDIAMAIQAGGLRSPESPPVPTLIIIPGDREVTITWNDLAVKTPDSYYYYVEEQGWNTDGYYKEYDFEGYRVYRSFVGPSDSHSELLADFNKSSGNLQFNYVDKQEDDDPYFRLTNGMKVWYAVQAYDKNYDNITGAMFSMPDPTSGKRWNRPTPAQAYQVIPRSDASNFIPASLSGVTFTPPSGVTATPVDAPTAELAGAGDGNLIDAPVYLQPQVDFTFVPVNNERLTQDMIAYLECTDIDAGSRCNYLYGTRSLRLVDGSFTSTPLEVNVRARAEPTTNTFLFNGPVDTQGQGYAISADFKSLMQGDFRSRIHYTIDLGGYTGAEEVWVVSDRCGQDRQFGFAPSVLSFVKSSRITVTWQDAGGGNLTLAVQNLTLGESIAFGPFFDDFGWGFIEEDLWGTSPNDPGTLFKELKDIPNKADRTARMTETFPADNTANFGVYVNGGVYEFVGGDNGLTMPAAGTVMTMDVCFGTWNSDQTVFTMRADPPWPGDSWKIEVKPYSMNPEDADLSKIKVVPNPYIATSFLDLSPINRRIEFINLPDRCTIRIYSLGGNLVNVLNHIGANRQGWSNYTDWDRLTDSQPWVFTGYDNHSGTEPWNLRNRFGQTVASGLYFFHVTDSRGETYTGKFYVVL